MIPKKYPNSLLYKLSGNRLNKPSWLFGSMHMVCADDFEIKEKVLNALHKCSHYYMEVDLGDTTEMDIMQSRPEKIVDFEKSLTEKERHELEQILISRYGLSMEDARRLPPVALINKMTTDAIDCDDYKVAEMELLQIALNAGLQTGGLETALQQLEIAEKVFDGKEIYQQLKSSPAYQDLFKKMIAAYNSENLNNLAVFVTDKNFMSRKAYNILVVNRNKAWAGQIPELIKDNSAFIAIGAGHLPGENGIIRLLQKRGFSVNPVYR